MQPKFQRFILKLTMLGGLNRFSPVLILWILIASYSLQIYARDEATAPECELEANSAPALLRHISPEKRSGLFASKATAKELKKIEKVIEGGVWSDPLLSPENDRGLRLALQAHLSPDSKISAAQMGTLLFRWELDKAFRNDTREKLQTVSLLEGNKLSPFARRIFGRSPEEPNRGLSAEQLDRFEKILNASPILEQSISLIAIPSGLLKANIKDHFRGRMDSQQLLLSLKNIPSAHILIRDDVGGSLGAPADHIIVMAPSFTMLQSYGDISFNGDFPRLRPEIGFGSPTKVYQGMVEGYRPMGFEFPGVELNTADGLITHGYGFSYHDYFHNFKKISVKFLRLIGRLKILLDRFYPLRIDRNEDCFTLVDGLVWVNLNIESRALLNWRLFTWKMNALATDLDFLDFDATTLGAQVLNAFGSVGFGLTGLLLIDAELNPRFYESWGISVSELHQELGAVQSEVFLNRVREKGVSPEMKKLFSY